MILVDEASPTSKLKEEQVYEIRERLSRGEKQQAIADLYPIDQTTVSCIKTRKLWKHLP